MMVAPILHPGLARPPAPRLDGRGRWPILDPIPRCWTMRTTPIPLLRQLPCGFTIERCGNCGELAFADEICLTEHQASACPGRAPLDRARPRAQVRGNANRNG